MSKGHRQSVICLYLFVLVPVTMSTTRKYTPNVSFLYKYFAVHLVDKFQVYKTSILTFKDRDRYVSGEFRYRHGYAKHNPRKMVATWAEKEMRNLTRYVNGSILCPYTKGLIKIS